MTLIPHSPTPWTPRANNSRNVTSSLPDGGAHVVAVFASAADAAFAIRAANCHADMLKALKAVETWWLEQGMKDAEVAPYAIFATRAAIAQAEGRTP